MANREQIRRLKRGAKSWNTWRTKNPIISIDLSAADLHAENLSDADLSAANLNNADLRFANLDNADLRDAELINTELREANLSFANLGHANLSHADLRFADLRFADLTNTILDGAVLSDAVINRTSFGDQDLRVVKGLETVRHEGPSPLSINTIYLSQGDVPETFMRGTGAGDSFLAYMKSLVSKPIEYYPCFISYSSHDQAFAKRLHADLQSNGVRCWFAPEDLKIGDKIRQRIDENIRLYDKLLLVLSEHSIASDWVAYEVEKALDKEPHSKRTVLFPIRIDDTILTCNTQWAQDIKDTRQIGDFTHWKDHDTYQKSLERLLRDLKAKSNR